MSNTVPSSRPTRLFLFLFASPATESVDGVGVVAVAQIVRRGGKERRRLCSLAAVVHPRLCLCLCVHLSVCVLAFVYQCISACVCVCVCVGVCFCACGVQCAHLSRLLSPCFLFLFFLWPKTKQTTEAAEAEGKSAAGAVVRRIVNGVVVVGGVVGGVDVVDTTGSVEGGGGGGGGGPARQQQQQGSKKKTQTPLQCACSIPPTFGRCKHAHSLLPFCTPRICWSLHFCCSTLFGSIRSLCFVSTIAAF